MADVSVEFGAKDTGLEQTLKTIQDQLVSLDGELKSGTLSFEEINKKMREAAQAEKLHASLGGTKDQIEALGLSFRKSSTEVDKFSQSQKEAEVKISAFAEALGEAASGAMSLDSRLAFVQKNLQEFRDKAASAELTAEELEDTLKKIGSLESAERRLKGIGDASSESKPKIEGLADATQDAGQKAEGAGGMFDSSFAKISAAFTVGNIAAQAFEKIIQTAFDIARAATQGFSDAINLGGRLNELSARTGEAAGKLLVLETAFKNSGISADQVGVAINKLQNFMADAAAGGEKQTSAMNNLGISMSELNGKTPTQQMQVFADKISAIKDPTDRAAAASEIFGDKLGGKLLPALTDFSGNLEDAREKVGSLEQVMDENAATFDAAGETFDAVKGKMAAFAAGILSETLPALGDLGEGMEEVDAAGLGQAIGSRLNPPLQDFVNILRGVTDLVKGLGESQQSLAQDNSAFGATYRAVNESLMGFNKMMHDVFTNFTPFGYAMQTLKNRGEELKASQDAATAAIAGTGNAAAEAKPKLDALPGAGQNLSLEFENLPGKIESASMAAGKFNASLDDIAPSVSDISTEAVKVKDDFSKISSLVAQLPNKNDDFKQSISDTNVKLELQPDIYDDIFKKISEAKDKEEERKSELEKSAEQLRKSIELQTQLKNAVANGNVKEQERVQKLIDAESAQKRIKKLTDEYIKGGLGKDEAETLAENLVKAEIAARKLPRPVESAKIEMKNFNSFVEWLQRQDTGKPMKPLEQKTKDARQEIEAFGKYIGSDFGGVSFPDLAKKMGIDTMGMTGSQQIDAILAYIKANLPGAKQNPIDEAAGKASAAAVKAEIEAQKPTMAVKPEVDQVQLQDQIGQMQAEITNEFTGGEGGPGGAGGAGGSATAGDGGTGGGGGEGGAGGDATADVTSITDILNGWTDIITAIRDNLPMRALA